MEKGEKRAKEKKGERKRKEKEEKTKFKYGIMFNLCILGFLRFSLENRFSFGLGFVERSHKPLNCWGYEIKTPIGRK